MTKTTFELMSDLITSLAQLLWPIVVFMLILFFRKELSGLLSRLKKGKILGQEVEFEQSVKSFSQSVEKAEKEVPVMISATDDSITKILDESAKDPKIGILHLASEIEKELRVLMASMGFLLQHSYQSALQAMTIFEQRGALPKHTMSSLKIFWDLRNRAIHEGPTENKENIIKVLDIGLSLLKTIQAIPHEVNVVYHPGVNVYSDKECQQIVKGVKGLILKTISPGGSITSFRIFPTTKNDYVKGKQVAWEWNLSKTWGECWYIDPDSGEKKYAWTSSGEFIGRHIDEI